MAGRSVRSRVRDLVDDGGPQRSSAPVFWLTLLSLVLVPVFAGSEWGRGLSALTLGSATLIALSRSGAHGLVLKLGRVVVGLAVVVSAVSPSVGSGGEGSALQILAAALLTVLLLLTPALVMARRLLAPRITLDTVMASLTTYLQIGLFFGSLYRLIDLTTSTPFFAQTSQPNALDFTYFSFITMTTVGYGDLTPLNPIGRSFAVVEAVTGQIFLVVVVALVVSNLGRDMPQRQRRTAGGDDDEDDDEDRGGA